MTFTGLAKRATLLLAAVAIVAPAAKADTSSGNFTFQCPGCTTTGNGTGQTFLLSVATSGTYSFWATGSANDEFNIYVGTVNARGDMTGPGGGQMFYANDQNSIAAFGSVYLVADQQYFVSAIEHFCDEPQAACRITLNSWELQGVTATPEPATFVLLATGLAGVMGVGARRRRQNKA